MMSLNMLIEFGDAFDFTGADFAGWCREAGFRRTEVIHIWRARPVRRSRTSSLVGAFSNTARCTPSRTRYRHVVERCRWSKDGR